MTKIDSKMLAEKYRSNAVKWGYTIEYLGGSDIEVSEHYLEKCYERTGG